MKALLKLITLALVLTASVDASAQARARKICLNTADLSVSTLRACPLGWRELDGQSLLIGQQVMSKFFEDGTEILGSNVNTVTRIAPGFYRITTSIADVNRCVFTVTQGLNSIGIAYSSVSFVAYPDPADTSAIYVESYDGGLLKSVGVNLLANCFLP